MESFTSFSVFLLLLDDEGVERQTLMRHRLTQVLVPHVTENPLFFHAVDVSEEGFKLAIDQMVSVGFEMLIFSFGSDFNLESTDDAYIQKIADQVKYANDRGIEVGGYDLICLDRGHDGYGGNVGDEWSVSAEDGSLTVDACFASAWYDSLHGKL